MTFMPKLSSHVLNPVIIVHLQLSSALAYWQILVVFNVYFLQELSRYFKNPRTLRFSPTSQQLLTMAFEHFYTVCSHSAEIIAVSFCQILAFFCLCYTQRSFGLQLSREFMFQETEVGSSLGPKIRHRDFSKFFFSTKLGCWQ